MQHNIRLDKPYGLANQKLCFIQMLLKVEKSREWKNQKRSKEWFVNTAPGRKNRSLYNTFPLPSRYFINPLLKQALVFTFLQYKSFENTVGKGEIARNEQFLLLPVFSTCLENFLLFSSNLKFSSTNFLSLEESKI